MRLNPFDTSRIDVGTTGGGGGMGKAGGVGCGTIIIAALGYFVFGLDPMQTAATVEGMQQGQVQSAPQNEDEQAICSSNDYARETCNALTSLNATWERAFQEQGYGDQFRQPGLRFATAQRFQTGCGTGSVGMGPFYCPADQRIYIDVNFYDQLAQMSGNRGDFARYYVVAHEYGHHVQTITGISDQIRSAQQQNPRQANQLQVLMELQADCYAGVWAGKNRNLIEPGDIEEGMQAAAAIGDDRLTGGRVSSENFTHGTSQQRSDALRLGLRGDDRACDNITNIR
ncbi:neutral zinc metallopeptidase [Qipengyuania sp. 6B39]|uniref:KPN_02809 family neutral zinc metallopeptidase n=1 Tax=Qipengyuania proteolytica TaxID=2867239 RepID=UPI001C8A106C|nr:neutral zinc metallopeptidase [Qipengyuania proteolytica]MBX7496271.1 neutral zinc metallopeptidase [Qipengyuania proteolytica]